ncbi:hypothetical protein L6452_03183 [Arctium lappa]|uniref:Uncharacterized protein n=1 Tax=Arctium lappa TaxID=4217 RepID=A0ACB9FLM4_ARCLA|nr:hypothetical protein L6452_03183 [Arctium lappa]
MQHTISVLTERVSSLEDTCRSQAKRLKRKHDNQDDPDHHEGEKRQRLSELELAKTVGTVQVQTKMGSGSGTQAEGQEQVQEQIMDLVLYDDIPTVDKPREHDGGSSIDPDNWAIIVDPYSDIDPTEEPVNTERALVVFQAEIDELLNSESTAQDYHPATQTSVEVPLLTYTSLHPNLPRSDVPRRSPPTSPVSGTDRTQPVHPLKWERVRINVPFLEESQKKLFAHWIRPYDEVVVHGLQSMTNREKQREILFVYKYVKDAFNKTKLRIKSVDHIHSCNFKSIKYSFFVVTREDGRQWHFSEANFASLELQDLIFLLRDLKTRTIRPGEVTDALEAVKRYMKCAMKFASVEDFQIGLESNQAKINLLKPDLSIPSNAQNVPTFTALNFLELGMTYVNDKGDMHFIRFSQIARLCDGTLLLLRDKLKRSIDQDVKGIQFLDPKYKCLACRLWVIDSGCSRHMTGFKQLLHNYVEEPAGIVYGYEIFRAERRGNLYSVDFPTLSATRPVYLLVKASKAQSWTWHRRLSHQNFRSIAKLQRQGLVKGLPETRCYIQRERQGLSKFDKKADEGYLVGY